MVTSQLCFRKVCPLSLLLVFVVLPTTVFSLEAGMTTLGQRILANPTLKPKGYHDSTPPCFSCRRTYSSADHRGPGRSTPTCAQCAGASPDRDHDTVGLR